ncbi:MAG: hypothetical protein ACJ8AW_38440 [Rhodopila sp.]
MSMDSGAVGPVMAAAPTHCGPADGATFICGVTNVEDFAIVPGTSWLIGSDLAAAGEQGFLYVFDTKSKSVTPVKPDEIAIEQDKTKYDTCPGAPDWKVFGPHGLDLTGDGQERTLYAVNHGGRESVEVFKMNLSKGRPSFTWTGCVVAPPHFWPDAVAALPDGGMIVTSLWDPTDPHRMDKLKNGEPVGALDEWQHGKGWSEVPSSQGMSGPNGVIVSKDGHEVYVALWSGQAVARISRGGGAAKREEVKTGFLTDNLRWGADDNSIFVGGQTAPVQKVIECFESKDVNCTQVTFQIDAMNPKTLKLTQVVKSGSYGVLGAGTGAVQIGNEIWVSTFRGDRVALLPAPAQR